MSDMNDFYYVSETEPFRLVDDGGLINDVFDQTGIADSLRQDLGGSNTKEKIDSRQYKRFQLNQIAIALIRSIHTGPLKIYGKSMGSIACAVYNAKPAKLGKIDNISLGGLMFHHVDGKTRVSKTLVLDILLASSGFYLANIPFKIITDGVVPDDIPDNLFETRQVRLQFQKLNVDQLDKLNKFIFNHGAVIGEIVAKD
jgi:hypothetical protein